MRPGLARLLLSLLLTILVPTSSTTAQSPRSDSPTRPPVLAWEPLPDLPDPIGFGGPVAGVHGDVLIVAGGSNFLGDPPWPVDGRPPGTKTWHDRIDTLRANPTQGSNGSTSAAMAWRDGGKLPYPLGYAPTISTADGVYILGGETWGPPNPSSAATNHPIAEVLLLKWDPGTETVDVVRDALPPLPKPCQYHAAAAIGPLVYVAASHAQGADSRQLDAKSFWSLDLSHPRAGQTWRNLPVWPGTAREKMTLVPQQSPAGTSLFLIGGSTWATSPDGRPDDAHADHFADGYRFDPASETWTRIADLPRLKEVRTIDTSRYRWLAAENRWQRLAPGEATPAYASPFSGATAEAHPRPLGAGPAIECDRAHVLYFSGATGRYVTLDGPDRPLFPREVLAYDTFADTWAVIGEMPLGVVTTSAVWWGDRIVIPSGETRPAVRTPKVQAARVRAQ